MVYPGIGLLRSFAASVSGTSVVPSAAGQPPSAAVRTYVKRLRQRIAAAAGAPGPPRERVDRADRPASAAGESARAAHPSCSIAAVAPHRPWGRSGGCGKHRQVTADEPLLDAPVRTHTAL
jgi:hypothetical protein